MGSLRRSCRDSRSDRCGGAGRQRRLAPPLLLVLVTGLLVAPAAQAASGDVVFKDTISFGGAGIDDAGMEVAVDRSGNPVFGGDLGGGPGGISYLYVRGYWAAGGLRWNESVLGRYLDPFESLALDRSGNVWFCGSRDGGANGMDWVVTKKNADGVLVGTYTYDGPGHDDDVAQDVVVDGAGNAYVTGYVTNAAGKDDMVLAKYSPAGTRLWLKRYDTRWHGNDIGYYLAINRTSLYVVGSTTRRGQMDVLVMRYTTSGRRLWVHSFDAGKKSMDLAWGAVANGTGVFICGSGRSIPGHAPDAMLLRASKTGKLLWQRWRAGTARDFDSFRDLALGPRGSVYVVGTVVRKTTGNDIYLARYTGAGKRTLSMNLIGAGPTAADDYGTGIVRAGSGSLFLSGTSVGSSGTDDAVAVCLSAGGKLRWSTYIDGAGAEDWGSDIAVSSDKVYLTGIADMGTYASDFLCVGLAR